MRSQHTFTDFISWEGKLGGWYWVTEKKSYNTCILYLILYLSLYTRKYTIIYIYCVLTCACSCSATVSARVYVHDWVCVCVHVCTCGDSVHDCVCGLCKTVLWGSCWLRRCGAERGSAVCLSVSTLPVAEEAGPGPGAVVNEHLSPSATVWLSDQASVTKRCSLIRLQISHSRG